TERQVPALPEPTIEPPDALFDLRPILDEELSRVAGKYREAIILCDLEGSTRQEAAQALGIAEGTLSSRLATGRRLLAARPAGRGVTLPASVPAVPAPLAQATVGAALAVSTGQAVGLASAGALSLSERVVRKMLLARLELAAALFFVAFCAAAGAVRYAAE